MNWDRKEQKEKDWKNPKVELNPLLIWHQFIYDQHLQKQMATETSGLSEFLENYHVALLNLCGSVVLHGSLCGSPDRQVIDVKNSCYNK